jgi:hypothetical protein
MWAGNQGGGEHGVLFVGHCVKADEKDEKQEGWMGQE